MVTQTGLAVRDPVAHARWLWQGYRELLASQGEYDLQSAVEEWPVLVKALSRLGQQNRKEAVRLVDAVWKEQMALRKLGVRLPGSKEAFLDQLGLL